MCWSVVAEMPLPGYVLTTPTSLSDVCEVSFFSTPLQVWDIRTKACVHTLAGHTNTVADIVTQAANPQVSVCACYICMIVHLCV